MAYSLNFLFLPSILGSPVCDWNLLLSGYHDGLDCDGLIPIAFMPEQLNKLFLLLGAHCPLVFLQVCPRLLPWYTRCPSPRVPLIFYAVPSTLPCSSSLSRPPPLA